MASHGIIIGLSAWAIAFYYAPTITSVLLVGSVLFILLTGYHETKT